MAVFVVNCMKIINNSRLAARAFSDEMLEEILRRRRRRRKTVY